MRLREGMANMVAVVAVEVSYHSCWRFSTRHCEGGREGHKD